MDAIKDIRYIKLHFTKLNTSNSCWYFRSTNTKYREQLFKQYKQSRNEELISLVSVRMTEYYVSGNTTPTELSNKFMYLQEILRFVLLEIEKDM